MDNQNDDEDDEENGGCYFPQRYMATLLAFVTLCFGAFSRGAFQRAVSIIVKHKHPKETTTINCPALKTEDRFEEDSIYIYEGVLYEWDEKMKRSCSNLFYSTYIVAHVVAGYLSDKYGAKYIVAFGIAGGSLANLFIPVLIHKTGGEIICVYIANIALGFFYSFLFPGIATYMSHWIPKRERTGLCTVAFSGVFFGYIVESVATDIWIRKRNDWTIPLYIYGGIGIVVFIFWWFFAYSDPISNPSILKTERKYIETEMRNLVDHRTKSVPLMKIFLSLEVWALVFGSFGHLWYWHFAFFFLRMYMRNVLHHSINHSTTWSTLPYIAMIISSYVHGFLADWILNNKYVNVLTLRKVYTNIGTMGPGVYTTVASFAACHRDVFKAMFVIANALAGCTVPGIRMVHMDIAPNYAGIITALTNSVGISSELFMYMLIDVSSPDKTIEDYKNIFFIMLAVAAVSNVIFVICARIQLQEWNTPTRTKEKNK